ncbi:MAG: response regulator [Chloroflexi bacterium]|nr:response regulator [Chloroflexota bacterium]
MTTFTPSSYRILVVDDDAMILELIEETLFRSGFQVATVTSGEDGLDWMRREGLPDLAVVDINMPFWYGWVGILPGGPQFLRSTGGHVNGR